MRKRWLAASYDKDLAAQIAEEHSLNPIAALLAVIRGLRDDEEIEDFFDPNPFFTLDPFALPDMDKAVERINRAIDNFECIAIFGDFDADGVTSTALLYTYLESKGECPVVYPGQADRGLRSERRRGRKAQRYGHSADSDGR